MLAREAKQKNYIDEYVFGTMIPEDHILVKLKPRVKRLLEKTQSNT